MTPKTRRACPEGTFILTLPQRFIVVEKDHIPIGLSERLPRLRLREVLLESTEGYDRGGKYDHDQTIATLTDYLLVAQNEACVMLYTRHDDHWHYQTVMGLESRIFLPFVDVTTALADVYP